ncbi:hypothetical protein, conserved in T. vivax, partial [Trypanosoma vivax Y486]
MGGAGESTL